MTESSTEPKRSAISPKSSLLSSLESDPRLNLAWFLQSVRKNVVIVAVTAIACVIATLLYTKSVPKIYEATVTIEFDPDVVRPLGNKSSAESRFWGSLMDNREYYETQYTLMTSAKVLSAVIKDLSLATDKSFVGHPVTEPMLLEDAVQLLRSKIKVEPLKGSRIVGIRVEDEIPAQAKSLADAVAREYVRQNLEKQVTATGDAVVWLSDQLERARLDLEVNENSLYEFKKSNELPSSSPEDVSKLSRSEMQAYDEALTKTRTRLQELRARAGELSKVTPDNPDQLAASELLNNAYLANLRKNYQDAVRVRREMLTDKGENHPAVKRQDETISQAKKDLLDEVKNIQGALARDLAIVERQEAGESGLYEAARRRTVELNLKELEYHRVDRARAQNEKLYAMLLEQMKEANLARMMNVNNVRIIDPSIEAKYPIRPKMSANLLAALALGLLLGVGFAVLREQADNSVKSPQDVEVMLGVPFLGLLPVMADEDAAKPNRPRRPVAGNLPPELLVHAEPRSGLAEAARAVRTNLLFMNPDRPQRVLLVTSSAPSEGKTTVACSISISMAQGGHRVCIVDCDLRRPRLHRIFDRVGDDGVTNFLAGEATMDQIARPTQVPNLDCVPAGPMPPNPADLLHSDKFKAFLDDLTKRYDRVILDSPPVAAVTDSAILSTVVDAVVFVVRAFQTSRNIAKQGMRALLDVDAPVAGVVLNAVDLDKRPGYYQYYYYRHEGYGPTTTEAPTTPAE